MYILRFCYTPYKYNGYSIFFREGVYSPRRMLPVYLHGIKYIQIQQTTKQAEGKINNQQREKRVKEKEQKTCIFIALKIEK
jgi:hypothetical protein